LSEPLPSVYLVRHGETAWSLSRQHTGRTDIPLTERGERDAQALVSRLANLQFQTVLTSPLIRARRTAELAGFGASAQPEPDLMEWDYGAYEGRRTSEIQAERPGWNVFEHGCPGGESLAQISARADRVITRVQAAKGNAVLFAHRDILRVIAARWIQLNGIEGRRLYLETASISILGFDHDRSEPVIRVLNT
jgi:broad specificity phosphatase PhoE